MRPSSDAPGNRAGKPLVPTWRALLLGLADHWKLAPPQQVRAASTTMKTVRPRYRSPRSQGRSGDGAAVAALSSLDGVAP